MTIKPPGEPVTPGHRQDKREVDHCLEGLFFYSTYFWLISDCHGTHGKQDPLKARAVLNADTLQKSNNLIIIYF